MKRGALTGWRSWTDLVNIADDRGRAVPQPPLPWDSAGARIGSEIPSAVWDRITERVPLRYRIGPAAAFLLAVVLLFIAIAGSLWLNYAGRFPPLGTAPLAIGAYAATVWAYLRLRHHNHAAVVIGAFLAEYRCCSCGYDLSGLRMESDGCTVCPECGAAWRLLSTQAQVDTGAS